jgi:hypothetical protein
LQAERVLASGVAALVAPTTKVLDATKAIAIKTIPAN